ncbi:hypothetical protein L596_004604 [Steinernema carpocapsae]|uniref:UPAR/Ly6 domain-containing protein n=1 Tax=Steinernema carpocapsae TaxID=34508 RepID=A0A4U8UXX4_STECR|nr:hypothetical protein L596_004604 [Steinernema carpocapsae]
MAVLSVWLLLLAVSFAEARECYNSVSRIGERVPSLDITYCRSEYCVKFDDAMGMTRRTCDREGLCNRIGTGCQFVQNYDLHAEAYACCCRGDLCNSAMPFSSTKAPLVYGAVLISLIYGYFRV